MEKLLTHHQENAILVGRSHLFSKDERIAEVTYLDVLQTIEQLRIAEVSEGRSDIFHQNDASDYSSRLV